MVAEETAETGSEILTSELHIGGADMLTQKMERLAHALLLYYERCFPSEYLKFVFDASDSLKLTQREVIIQVLFECCKYAFDYNSPKRSLRQHMIGAGIDHDDESQRKYIGNCMRNVKKYRKREYDLTRKIVGLDVPDLLLPSMNMIEQKLNGYERTDFQFWEIQNVRKSALPTAIVDKKICSKDTTLTSIREMSQAYDIQCTEFAEESRKGDAISGNLRFFTLEWKYSFDFMHEIATNMKERNIKKLRENQYRAIALLCGRTFLKTCLPVFDSWRLPWDPAVYYVESRMVAYRRRFIDAILTQDDCRINDLICYINELVTLICLPRFEYHYGPDPSKAPLIIHDWIKENTSEEDWISVFEEYNVFQAFIPEKVWDKQCLRHVKNIYDTIYISQKQ